MHDGFPTGSLMDFRYEFGLTAIVEPFCQEVIQEFAVDVSQDLTFWLRQHSGFSSFRVLMLNHLKPRDAVALLLGRHFSRS